MKLYIEQIADGTKTIVSEWTDNAQGAKVSFHNTCKDLLNDNKTQQAKVRICDENFKTFGNWEEVIDKTGDDPENPGKLFVMAVSNGNLMTNLITEWTANKAGIKGAMVDYHGKCAMYLNAPDVEQANVRVANETLDVYNGKAEEIRHEQNPEE